MGATQGLEPSSATARDRLTAYFWSHNTLRSRSVGHTVLHDTVNLPAAHVRLLGDWRRDIAKQLNLQPGDVEQLPLARARMRWPEYLVCLEAAAQWSRTVRLGDALALAQAQAQLALMACRGAHYHHDAVQYAGSAFCNLFVSDDQGLDVHFPVAGQRFALTRGTILVFDTAQPHAVIDRGSNGFDAADFQLKRDRNQVFLTWELPIDDARVAQALGIVFDTDAATTRTLDAQQVWVDGAPAEVCAASGQWRTKD